MTVGNAGANRTDSTASQKLIL